ncbi:uncharacterized protein LOC117116597 [Anneissia japonica]|uniref:uncharacterized protein LOC117116597 n=1 Tax=Anneissia japonica TaxID=1529436 RepID=UPI001425A060|nr:uncharacterized protein LOC117116597 [Anneissia japonica]
MSIMRLLVFMVMVCVLLQTVQALHYRGGTFYWKRITDKKVKIFWRLSFQKSEGTYPCHNVGDKIFAEYLNILRCKTCVYDQTIIQKLPLTCISSSTENDWNLFEGSMTYEAESSTFVMSYETEGRCTDSSWLYLQNFGSGRCWNLLTQVDLSITNDSPRVVAGIPLQRVRQGCETLIDLKPTDPNGDIIRCRWADPSKQNPSECPGDAGNARVCGSPSEEHAEIFEDTCKIKFQAEGALIGYYGVSVMIEDFDEDDLHTPKSTVPYQFLIQVTEPGSCVGPTVTLDEDCAIIKPDELWQAIVTAELPSGSDGNRVEELMYSLPREMTYTEDNPPPGGYVQSTLSLQTTEIGEYDYSITATDDYGTQGPTAFGKVYVTNDDEVTAPDPPQILIHESFPRSNTELDETLIDWFIKFDSPVSRPENSAYVTITDVTMRTTFARYDASNPDEVDFPTDDPTIARYKAPTNLIGGREYLIQIDESFGVVKYTALCYRSAIKSDRSLYNFKNPKPPEPEVRCGQSEITAYIPKSYVNNMSVNKLHLIDPRCNSKDNGTHLIVQFAYDACGTYIKKKSSDLTRFINILRDDPEPYKTSTLITRAQRQVNIRIICEVKGVGIANVFFNPDTSVESSTFKATTTLEANLELYEDKSYSTLVPYGTAKGVKFPERLFFTARAQDSSKEVAIESCRATAKYKTCSKFDKKYEFISNGCPVDDTVQFTSSGFLDQKRFSIETFAMINYGIDDTVWVMCSFLTCDKSDTQSACKDMNSPICGSPTVGKRRKRSAADVVTQAFMELQLDME